MTVFIASTALGRDHGDLHRVLREREPGLHAGAPPAGPPPPPRGPQAPPPARRREIPGAEGWAVGGGRAGRAPARARAGGAPAGTQASQMPFIWPKVAISASQMLALTMRSLLLPASASNSSILARICVVCPATSALASSATWPATKTRPLQTTAALMRALGRMRWMFIGKLLHGMKTGATPGAQAPGHEIASHRETGL